VDFWVVTQCTDAVGYQSFAALCCRFYPISVRPYSTEDHDLNVIRCGNLKYPIIILYLARQHYYINVDMCERWT